LKLLVADNAAEARMILEKQIDDNMSLTGSMRGGPQPIFGASFNNRASNVGMARIDTMSELIQEPVEERRCETERATVKKMDDVANNFIDNMKNMFERTITEVKSYVAPQSTQAETVQAQEPVKMPEVEKPVEFMIDTSSKKEAVPEEGNFMTCTWCKGAGCHKCG
jgi:hypothetical protein